MGEKKEYKNLAVDPELHQEIKTEAARRGLSIKDYIAEAHAAFAHKETDAPYGTEKWLCTACNHETEFEGSATVMNMFYRYCDCPQCGIRGQWVKAI